VPSVNPMKSYTSEKMNAYKLYSLFLILTNMTVTPIKMFINRLTVPDV